VQRLPRRVEGIGHHVQDGVPAGEQGENFKINLYDHGCGVVVGDFDRDGFDDVYFLNQLGPNALYRNRGLDKDGNWLGFEDVTKMAGVGLGDRVCVGRRVRRLRQRRFPGPVRDEHARRQRAVRNAAGTRAASGWVSRT